MESKGFSLNLNGASTEDRDEQCTKEDDARAEQEEDIKVCFVLPDTTIEGYFKRGQTISVLKSFLDTEFDLDVSRQTLYFGNTKLLDPFTLNDYPEIRNENEIEISVDSCREEK